MRLGLHVNTHGRKDMVARYIDEVRPPVMKWLVSGIEPDMMRAARDKGVKVVLRRVTSRDLPEGPGGMQMLRDEVLSKADEFRGTFDFIEAANEERQGLNDRTQLDRLADLMLAFMKECDKRGHKACVFNFSVGQPEIDGWTRPSMLACLAHAHAHGHAIGVHEYYKPVPWEDTTGWTPEGNAKADGTLLLRVVKALKVLRARGVGIPRFIITESGRDNIPGKPGPEKGWRNDGQAPYDDFMAQYCKHLRFHPEILGIVDFGCTSTSDSSDESKRWHSFDLTARKDMFERMINVMRAIPLLPVPVPVPAPEPPTKPEPTPGPEIDVAELWRQADEHQSIRLNPQAGLQRAILASGLAVTSDEWSFGPNFVAQRAEPLAGGSAEVFVFDARSGSITRFKRPAVNRATRAASTLGSTAAPVPVPIPVPTPPSRRK